MGAKNTVQGVFILLAGLMVGCAAQTASYRPSLTNTFSAGHRASLYRIVVDNHNLGTVKVYSEGGYRKPADGSQPVIDVRLRIRNTSDAPIRLKLDQTDIDLDTDTENLVIKEPIQTAGVTSIPPGAIGRIALFYALPGKLQPGNINSFDFNWALDTGQGAYSQTTPFLRRMVRHVYTYSPSYYYWWGDPWGSPWGYPWGYLQPDWGDVDRD
jgi:hypothetical protein